MEVRVLTATKRPVDVVSLAAGMCYGKENVDARRVERCVQSGHHSVLEHASATFDVRGISRSCSLQLVRHRLASYSQMSQRYCRIDVESGDWYVVPPSMDELREGRQWYEAQMARFAEAYLSALDGGARPEDARFLLPEACKTNITVSMNCRELFHFLDLRQGRGAQWEIRELAHEMEDALAKHDGQWAQLLAMRGSYGE